MAASVNDILAHHGVLGQKWGVRHDTGHEGKRATNRKIERLDRQWARKAAHPRTYYKIYNHMAENLNGGGIDRLNNSPEFKDKFPLKETVEGKFDNPALAKKYLHAFSNEATRLLNEASKNHGLSASGKGLVFEYDVSEMAMPSFSVHQIGMKHSVDDAPDANVKVVIKDGYIVGITVTPAGTVAHSDDVDDFLAHYGVLGMHWGQHKIIDRIRTANKEHAKKKKAIAVQRKANSAAARKAGYSSSQRTNDLHNVKQDGVWRIEKNIAEGQKVGAARTREYARATGIAAAIGAGLVAINYSPLLLRKANVGLVNLAKNINAKRGAEAAAKLFSDNKGLTSYPTVALTFDKLRGTWA